jgi:hypothetical protein
MESNKENSTPTKIQFTRGNPNFQAFQNIHGEEGEEENEPLSDEEQLAETKQLEEEEREREIEKTYEEEDESDKKDRTRF